MSNRCSNRNEKTNCQSFAQTGVLLYAKTMPTQLTKFCPDSDAFPCKNHANVYENVLPKCKNIFYKTSTEVGMVLANARTVPYVMQMFCPMLWAKK